MLDKTKIQSMRFLFARPSSLHDDPLHLIKWSADGLPRVHRERAAEVVTDEGLLVELYDELVQRESTATAAAAECQQQQQQPD